MFQLLYLLGGTNELYGLSWQAYEPILSTEIFDGLEFTAGPQLPSDVNLEYCANAINRTHVAFTGGTQFDNVSIETYSLCFAYW